MSSRGGLQHPVEHRLEVELGQQAAPDVDQAREPMLVQAVERGHARRRAYRRVCAATWAARGATGTTSTGQAAWRRISSSRPATTSTSTSPRVWATSAPAPRPATRVAAAAGARPWAWASYRLRDRFVAVGDEPHSGARTLGERRGERDRVVGRPGRPARDGDAGRRERPDEAVSVRRHHDRARRAGDQPRDTGLAAEQVLADDDRVGSLAARQRLDGVGEGHAGERQVAHARIGAQRGVHLLAGVAQVGAAASGRLGAAGQWGRRGRHDVRHDDRRVVVCQLRREDEGVAAFGVTGEGDEDGGEHSLTVGLAVSAAIRERMPTRLWQSRSHLACQHRWTRVAPAPNMSSCRSHRPPTIHAS